MGILDGKQILVTGITHNTSIAYKVAELAQAEGASVICTAFGRALGLATRVTQKLDPVPPMLELDATDEEALAKLPDQLRNNGFSKVDGIVHSIAFANPERALGGAFLDTQWDDVAISLKTSTYSLVSLTRALRPMFAERASVVGLTFDASVSWPAYDWMGVAKAGLESASRYLARYLGKQGVRSNIVAAGPLDTIAKKAIPGANAFNDVWADRAPLGWDPEDATPVAKAVVCLLSDYFPATTGEIVHVDGGLCSTGA